MSIQPIHLIAAAVVVALTVPAIFLVRAEEPAGGSDSAVDRQKREERLRRQLTPLQYAVTQEALTEPPFDNAYWNEYAEGIYVDVVTGEPLFSSRDKFRSGTGWPSFSRPIHHDAVVLRRELTLFGPGTEVRSASGDSHLGHLFEDGPEPTGQRYCMNSAALKFVPLDQLEAAGYGRYRSIFDR